jgi:hypothetical protein
MVGLTASEQGLSDMKLLILSENFFGAAVNGVGRVECCHSIPKGRGSICPFKDNNKLLE